MPSGSGPVQRQPTSAYSSPTLAPPLAREVRTLPRTRADLGSVHPAHGQVQSRPFPCHGPAHLDSASDPAHSAASRPSRPRFLCCRQLHRQSRQAGGCRCCASLSSRVTAAAMPGGLLLGDEAPNFEANTTVGRIRFHDYLGDS